MDDKHRYSWKRSLMLKVSILANMRSDGNANSKSAGFNPIRFSIMYLQGCKISKDRVKPQNSDSSAKFT